MIRRFALLRRVLMGVGVISLVLLCAFLLIETPESAEKPEQNESGIFAQAMFVLPVNETNQGDAEAAKKTAGGEKPQPKAEERGQRLFAPRIAPTDANGNWVVSGAYIRELSRSFPPGDLPI